MQREATESIRRRYYYYIVAAVQIIECQFCLFANCIPTYSMITIEFQIIFTLYSIDR